MYNRPCLIPVAYGSGKGEIRDEPAARVWLWKPETHRKRRQDEGRGDRGAALLVAQNQYETHFYDPKHPADYAVRF